MHVGGHCRYIKQITLNNSFEGFFVELNLRSKKWLLGCSYNHHKENIASYLRNVSAALDKLCADYKNIFLLGGLNVEVKEQHISVFMSAYKLKSLVKQKTCFKIPDNPSYIDLILTTLRKVSKIAVCLKRDSLTFTTYNHGFKTVFSEAKTENSKL